MNRATPLLWATLAAALLAQEPADTVTLRLKGGASVTGRLVRIEKDGVLLRWDIGGEAAERLWTWEQLDDADPMKPRRAAPPTVLPPDLETPRSGPDRPDDDLLRVSQLLSHLGRPDREALSAIGRLDTGSTGRARDVAELRRRILDQSYEDALAVLDRIEAADPWGPCAAKVLRGELTSLLRLPVEDRVVLFYDAAIEEALWALAKNGSIGWASASFHVREELAEEVCARTADRFSLDAETARRTWDRRPADRQIVASWGAGSFLADALGSETMREEWWSAATPEERHAALKGLAAEALGQVIQVVNKDCPGCGARGQKEGRTCERCAGRRVERVVIYR